jgi:hypothetical protein
MPAADRCAGCPHAAHRDQCPAKGRGRCVPVLDPQTGEPHGWISYARNAPCLCPRGWCHHCRAPVAGASPFPLGGGPEIDVDVGSADDPAGRVAVRQLADGTLGAVRLQDGEEPGAGWWRGREHACAGTAP